MNAAAAIEPSAGDCFLELKDITKRFGGVRALEGVNLKIRRGEVLGLLGDNGAGKTTLVKIMSGVHQPTSGELLFDGVHKDIADPDRAHSLGVQTVFQDLALIPNLQVADNFFIGRELTTNIFPGIKLLRRKEMERDAAETLKKLDIRIQSLRVNVDSLSGGQRQAIAIARAIRWQANLVLLDEPTAALAVPEQKKVLELARQLASQGVAVVYITHNMNDVMAVTDRVAVLYQGKVACEVETKKTNQREIVSMIMTGSPDGFAGHH